MHFYWIIKKTATFNFKCYVNFQVVRCFFSECDVFISVFSFLFVFCYFDK